MTETKSNSLGSHESANKKTQNSNMILHGNKFIRRHDLTPLVRLQIAFTVLMARTCGTWGKVTELSRQYMISRMFVYMLANDLSGTGSVQ